MTVHLLSTIFPLVDPVIILHWLIAAAKVIVFLAAVAVAALISAGLIRLIWRIRWLSQKQTNTIRLANLGNVESAFRVAAVSPDRQLNFNYNLDGASLPIMKMPAVPRQMTPVSHSAAMIDLSTTDPVQEQPMSENPQKIPNAKDASGAKEALTKSAKKADEGIKQVGGITGMIIDILATVASLIPGSVGANLKKQVDGFRSQKNAINSTLQEPAIKAKQIEHLKGQVNNLGTAAGVPAKEGVPVPAISSPVPVAPQTGAAANSGSITTGSNGRHLQAQPSLGNDAYGLFSTFVQLPPLAPAGTHTLELSIDPQRKYRGGAYVYWLYTQPVEQPGLPSVESLDPTKIVQKITVKTIPPGYWALSILLSASIIIFNVLWLIYFYFWLARFLA